jgi:excisionase family DNA binding protein
LTERLEGSEEQLARYRLLSGQAGVRSAPWGRRARPVSRRQREEESGLSVQDEILTTDEVCILLKIKKATLYRHTSQGTGPPFYKIGKHNRWKRSEVMAWFDSHLDELCRSGR